MFDTLICQIGKYAETQPDKLAAAFKKEQLSYGQLYRKIISVAALIRQEGVKAGDRVAFSALSKPEMIAVYLGIQYLGAIAVFLDKNATPGNIAMICQEADVVLLLTDKPMKEYAGCCRIRSLKKLYEEAFADEIDISYIMPEDNSIAEILFTTGTTGRPKGVMLSYKAVYHILSNTIEGIGIREDDRVLIPLPLNHSFALRVLRAVLYRGATVILQNGFTFAKEIENNMEQYQCTAMAAVPASLETVQAQMQDHFAPVLGKLRYIEVGAGSLTTGQRLHFTKVLPNTTFFNTWGSSETGGALFLNVTEAVRDPEKIKAVGKPLPCVQVRVLDPMGVPIKSDPSHPGRMSLRGDMIMSGYWNREELTAETIKDGWLLTGDMVYTDDDGFVYMLGRADDIINVGGEKVSPIEVENIASTFPQVRECACIGAEDPEGILGQVPVLFLAAKSGYSEEELKRYLSSKMERYKIPHYFVVIEEIPRNRMKKIDRKALANLWENRGGRDLVNPVMQAILNRRSIRRFTDQEIPENILDMILKAGYHAPSGHNMQSWRFTVLEKEETIQRLKELGKETAGKHKVYFYGFENPKIIILVSNDVRNPDGCQDASCAAENMMLAAQSYGIGSVWLNGLMTLRDKEPVKGLLDTFGIPENHTIWACVALGYPVAEGALLKKKENVIRFVDRETDQ